MQRERARPWISLAPRRMWSKRGLKRREKRVSVPSCDPRRRGWRGPWGAVQWRVRASIVAARRARRKSALSRSAIGRVVRRRAVRLDIVAKVVIGVPPTGRRERNAGPRRRVNALFARAGSESPRHSPWLDRQDHCIPSHLSGRDFPQDYDRHTPAPDRVTRRIDHVFDAVD
jgi:hypothetical protein